jgi:hypothetical protein
MLGWGEARDDFRVPRAPIAHLDLIERHRLRGPRRQGGRDGHQVCTGLAAVGGGGNSVERPDQPARGRRGHRLLAQPPVTHGWDTGDRAGVTAACGG